MSDVYYVYLHIKSSNGEPFYVGKGKANRVTSTHGRNKFWHNIVNKYGYDIIFLDKNLSPEKAIELETYWIERIGRRDLGNGTLVNLTNGGDGTAGRKVDRSYYKGENNPFYGKTHSEDTKEKIRESNKRRVWSEESKLKRLESSIVKTEYGYKKSRSRVVLNTQTGIYYMSIREASTAYNMKEDSLRHYLSGYRKNITDFIFVDK